MYVCTDGRLLVVWNLDLMGIQPKEWGNVSCVYAVGMINSLANEQ